MITFGLDTTLRWACQAGDYVFWARFQGLFAPKGKEYSIADIWELRDGNFITLTNRRVDLPDGFELHPLEVAGPLVWWMTERLNEGYVPQEPMDGPNLWRVFAGDRLVWVGARRGAVDSKDGVLGLVDFHENALVYGEPLNFSLGFPTFGGFEQGEPSEEGLRLCNAGRDALLKLRPPDTASVDNKWTIG